MRRTFFGVVLAMAIVGIDVYVSNGALDPCNRKIPTTPVNCTTGATCESATAPCPDAGVYDILSYYTDCSLSGGTPTSHCIMKNFTGTEVCSSNYRCKTDPKNPKKCIKGAFVNLSFMDPAKQQAVGASCTAP